MGKFNTKESYKHKVAKELLQEWIVDHNTVLLDQYDKRIYPYTLKSVLEYPIYQDYDPTKYRYIFDIGFTDKNFALKLAVEIYNTSRAKKNKITYCSDNDIGLYEVDVNEILNQLHIPKVIKCTTLNSKKEFENNVHTGFNDSRELKSILLFNKYYTEYDPQQLTPKELHALIILKDHASYLTGETTTTFNTLGYLLPFTKLAEKKKNAAVARDILQSLRSKKVIEYHDPKDANEPFQVKTEHVKYVEGDMRTTYQPVPEFILTKTDDPDELYVLIVIHSIARMCEKGEYSKTYFRNKKNFGGLLGKGNTTAEKIVNRMCEKKILFYYESDVRYNTGRNKFEQNQGRFYLFPQENIEIKA